MSGARRFLAGLLAAVSFGAAAEPAPLSIEEIARTAAAATSPAAALAATRDLPYRHIGHLNLEGLEPAKALRVEATARFFDALLTDLEATSVGERMTVAYGQWVRLNGRTPDAVETARAFLAYRDWLSKRNEARMHQRIARSSLALALSRSALPSELVDPELSASDLPTSETLHAMVQNRLPQAGKARELHNLTTTVLELDWLIRAEKPRTKARSDFAVRVVDEAREQLGAGASPDLGGAMAAIVEAQLDERRVDYRIQLLRYKLEGLAAPRRP